MNFQIGQKVGCVDDARRTLVRYGGWYSRWRGWHRLDHNLNRGDVYHVLGVTILTTTDNKPFILLRVTGAWHFEHPEFGFPSFQFRPVIERKTDIAVFTSLLTPSKPKQLIDA